MQENEPNNGNHNNHRTNRTKRDLRWGNFKNEAAVEERDSNRLRGLLGQHESDNSPCFVWVPVFNAQTGSYMHHALDIDKTLRDTPYLTHSQLDTYIKQNNIPPSKIMPGSDYAAYAAQSPNSSGHVREQQGKQTVGAGTLERIVG